MRCGLLLQLRRLLLLLLLLCRLWLRLRLCLLRRLGLFSPPRRPRRSQPLFRRPRRLCRLRPLRRPRLLRCMLLL
jgi:hypothetical protein